MRVEAPEHPGKVGVQGNSDMSLHDEWYGSNKASTSSFEICFTTNMCVQVKNVNVSKLENCLGRRAVIRRPVYFDI